MSRKIVFKGIQQQLYSVLKFDTMPLESKKHSSIWKKATSVYIGRKKAFGGAHIGWHFSIDLQTTLTLGLLAGHGIAERPVSNIHIWNCSMQASNICSVFLLINVCQIQEVRIVTCLTLHIKQTQMKSRLIAVVFNTKWSWQPQIACKACLPLVTCTVEKKTETKRRRRRQKVPVELTSFRWWQFWSWRY